MNAELWALVGVVVGAVLGGAAQIITSLLTDRRAHQKWIRERQVDAYQAFMAAAEAKVLPLHEAFYGSTGGPVPEDWGLDLTTPKADVALVGSRAASEAAQAVMEAVWNFADTHPGPYPDSSDLTDHFDCYDVAITRFRQVVRADLKMKAT